MTLWTDPCTIKLLAGVLQFWQASRCILQKVINTFLSSTLSCLPFEATRNLGLKTDEHNIIQSQEMMKSCISHRHLVVSCTTTSNLGKNLFNGSRDVMTYLRIALSAITIDARILLTLQGCVCVTKHISVGSNNGKYVLQISGSHQLRISLLAHSIKYFVTIVKSQHTYYCLREHTFPTSRAFVINLKYFSTYCLLFFLVRDLVF